MATNLFKALVFQILDRLVRALGWPPVRQTRPAYYPPRCLNILVKSMKHARPYQETGSETGDLPGCSSNFGLTCVLRRPAKASWAEKIVGNGRTSDQCAQRRILLAIFFGQRFHRHEELMSVRQLMAREPFVMIVFKPV